MLNNGSARMKEFIFSVLTGWGNILKYADTLLKYGTVLILGFYKMPIIAKDLLL